MALGTKRPGYLAYMLRLWRTGGGQEQEWKASLESPQTGERLGFRDLPSLYAFLSDKTRSTRDNGVNVEPDSLTDLAAISKGDSV